MRKTKGKRKPKSSCAAPLDGGWDGRWGGSFSGRMRKRNPTCIKGDGARPMEVEVQGGRWGNAAVSNKKKTNEHVQKKAEERKTGIHQPTICRKETRKKQGSTFLGETGGERIVELSGGKYLTKGKRGRGGTRKGREGIFLLPLKRVPREKRKIKPEVI